MCLGLMVTSARGGSATNAPAPKTDQTGVARPNPRFTVQADTNCVVDNLTGLMWARNANIAGAKNWADAVNYCTSLTYGGYSDWRLPNQRELLSLIDNGRSNRALCNTAGTGKWTENDPFTGVGGHYWSSTTGVVLTGSAWFVGLLGGYGSPEPYEGIDPKTCTYNVWPVRGGNK